MTSSVILPAAFLGLIKEFCAIRCRNRDDCHRYPLMQSCKMTGADDAVSFPEGSVELQPAPSDGVTHVSFGADERVFVCTWSGEAALHSGETGQLLVRSSPTGTALLDGSWVESTRAVVAGLDGSVRLSDATFKTWDLVAQHEAPVRSVLSMEKRSCIVSAGWDAALNITDWRQRGIDNAKTTCVKAGGKLFGAAPYGTDAVVFITSERKVCIVDIRKTSEFIHDKTPPALTYQLRSVSANTAGDQYVVGSTEGRVAVEWPLEPGRGYSFRCHRLDGLAFPINSIRHNNKYPSTFATGGGDGHVSLWDAIGRKRIAQYMRQSTSIASIDFNTGSTRMVIAVSYTFEEGEKDHPADSVHIRPVFDSDISSGD